MNPDEDAKKKTDKAEEKQPEEAIALAGDAVPPATAPSVSDLGSTVDLDTLASSASGSTQNQALLDIKHQALSKLGDLVDNLEHSPEQHFQTLMMIIQETDNIQMIDKAYATRLATQGCQRKSSGLCCQSPTKSTISLPSRFRPASDAGRSGRRRRLGRRWL